MFPHDLEGKGQGNTQSELPAARATASLLSPRGAAMEPLDAVNVAPIRSGAANWHLPVSGLLLLVIAGILWRLARRAEEGVRVLHKLSAQVALLERRIAHAERTLGETPEKENGSSAGKAGSTALLKTSSGEVVTTSPREVGDSPRPLYVSAAQFKDCLLGVNNVDVSKFMYACKEFNHVLQRMGSFTLVMSNEVNTNVRKIERTYQLSPEAYRSMRDLLEAEVDSGMHRPEANLANPSSAMGLLWARRGLLFWCAIYQGFLEGIRNSDNVCIKKLAEQAHTDVLKPFTGWVSTSSFFMVTNAMPEWQKIFENIAPSNDVLLEDIATWCEAVIPVLKRMEAIHLELDLEDTRRSI